MVTEAPLPYRTRFLQQYTRWLIWIVAIGVGYHCGQFVGSLFYGPQAAIDGVIFLLTGVMGDALFAIVIGAVAALVLASCLHKVLQWRITWRVAGIIAAICFPLGIYYVTTNAHSMLGVGSTAQSTASAAPQCTSRRIATMFADFKILDAAPSGKTGAANADKLWRDAVECDATSGLNLSDRDHGIYVDAMLFGIADSAFAYYSVGRYKDAREYLNRYKLLGPDFRKIAQMKGWTKFLGALDQLDPIMKSLEENLDARGYK